MRAVDFLYPALSPFSKHTIVTDDGHQIYVEESGNPHGVPVVVCHGGPGGGSSPFMRRYFDPNFFRIVLFDQRGCGKSKPHSSVENNTTWHLVADMERIRAMLDIRDWYLFGGSWGATLALVYAQTHPERVRGMTLRGVFLARPEELEWFYGGGAGAFFPEAWAHVIAPLSKEERIDVVAAYHKRLFSGHYPTEMRFAQLWSGWENALASIESNGQMSSGSPLEVHAFARLENHYFYNLGWLTGERAILNNMHRISDIPATIIQGRQDMICPPQSAYDLTEKWLNARLQMIPAAGHAMSERGITPALIKATKAWVNA